jgi:AbrB family looped-hinge helix DNA binding protein
MAKVTSKLQLTVPKALAEEFGIRPGDHLDIVPAGDAIRMVPRRGRKTELDRSQRLRLFDHASERQRRRQGKRRRAKGPAQRGWRREDLYTRGLAR